jgi:hypothetical protein
MRDMSPQRFAQVCVIAKWRGLFFRLGAEVWGKVAE